MKKNEKMQDFGEKIGGAKKDLWAFFHGLSEEEKSEAAKKDTVWPRPDYQALANGGAEVEALYWQNEMRKSVKPRPQPVAGKCDFDGYVGFVLDFKADVEKCLTLDAVSSFYGKEMFKYLTKRAVNNFSTRCWDYTDEGYRQFFNGNAVLKYYGSDTLTRFRIASDCKAEGFLKTPEQLEREKYGILMAGKDEITVTDCNGYIHMAVKSGKSGSRHFYPKSNPAIPDAETLFIVACVGKLHGIYASEQEAKDAIDFAVASELENQEKAEKRKKSALLPPQLTHIERTGSDYRFLRVLDGAILTARYGLRGGEFGNYMTSKDRNASVNMAYDAFDDLSAALGISVKDISLGGNLAIAFGARGSGNALAHYEPVKNVINITKKRGAGSLAHEWGHALDMYIGKAFGQRGFASSLIYRKDIPESFKDIIKTMKIKDGKKTLFLSNSEAFDKMFQKAGNGYWASAHEMFARAFACYVEDRLGGKSDYLVGHADTAVYKEIAAYPTGSEREAINAAFDAFFADMLSQGVFKPREEAKKAGKESKNAKATDYSELLYEGAGGQFCFF